MESKSVAGIDMRKMIKELYKDKYIWGFLIIAVVTLFMTAIFYRIGFFPYTPMHSDGNGYYMYLPAVFTYHDLGMNFVYNGNFSDPSGLTGTFFPMATGQVVDKYTMGVAVLQMPFFLLADIVARLFTPEQADGFSAVYQLGNIASGCFYYFIGSVFTYKISRKYADEHSAFWAVIAVTFGTGLFHYISRDGGYSHVYSYAMIALFILLVDKYEQNATWRIQLLGGICFGLLTLVRVTNVVIVLIYVFYRVNSFQSFLERLKKILLPKNWWLILLGIVLVWVSQLLYWKWAAGSFFVNSYNLPGNEFDERFYWTSPEIINVLFTTNRGVFFWCPVVILSVIAILIFLKKVPEFQLGMLFSTMTFTYITASWWAYDGLCGFTNRFFVDLSAVFIFQLALLLKGIRRNRKMRIIVTSFIVFSVLWTMLFMVEYWFHETTKFDVHMEQIIQVFDWYKQILFS